MNNRNRIASNIIAGIIFTLFIAWPGIVFSEKANNSLCNNHTCNIAIDKTYTIPPPNYTLTNDPYDYKQLTDGKYSRGDFWTQKSTVGWFGYKPVPIIIDLGEVVSISGVSFNTASGGKKNGLPFGPQWPELILVFVSANKDTWFFSGELIRLSDKNGTPSVEKYCVHKYQTHEFMTFGRYVQFVVQPYSSRYIVVDEVEVFQGEAGLPRSAKRGKQVIDVERFRKVYTFNQLIRKQLRYDLKQVFNDLNIENKNSPSKDILLEKANLLAKKLENISEVEPEGFHAILPMTELEEKIYRLQAEVWRHQEKPLLRLWKNHRWDPLDALQEPENNDLPFINLRMMNNEYRAEVLNLTNAADHKKQVEIQIAGLPGGINPEYISVYQVLTTGTRRSGAVSAALTPLEKDGSTISVLIPSGMTKQLWFSFHPENIPPGIYNAHVVISSDDIEKKVPLRLEISKIQFSQKKSLFVSGWSYTNIKNSKQYYNAITPENRRSLIKTLQEYGVNAPWATSKILPLGQYDDLGRMTRKPDTKQFDEWVSLWPKAKLYLVFLRPFRTFKDVQPGTKNFRQIVSTWANFWKQHMINSGIQPSKLGILICDEPNNERQFKMIMKWSDAIKAGASEFVIWEDPHPSRLESGESMMGRVDVLCIHRGYWLRKGPWFQDIFQKQKENGRELWFYSPDRHSRSLDPYTYYLGQAWHAFQIGAIGSAFWSFSDMRDTPVWNEYLSDETGPFSPLFIGLSEIATSKYMEAIREGAEDYEYLSMLKEKILSLEKEGIKDTSLLKAKNLLSSACKRVLKMQSKNYYQWNVIRDRSEADKVRLEILEQIESLQSLHVN